MVLTGVLCQGSIILSYLGLPKLSLKTKVIQVGNGASVNILFIIPTTVTTQSHIFEISVWFLKYMKVKIWFLVSKTLLSVGSRNEYEGTKS